MLCGRQMKISRLIAAVLMTPSRCMHAAAAAAVAWQPVAAIVTSCQQINSLINRAFRTRPVNLVTRHSPIQSVCFSSLCTLTGTKTNIHTYIQTNLYSAKNRENESEALTTVIHLHLPMPAPTRFRAISHHE